MKHLLRVSILTIYSLLLTVNALAQVTTSTVSGNISDAFGPASGAIIIVTNPSMGTQYYSVSDDSGNYRILNIESGGPYHIKVRLLGYNTVNQKDIYLTVGDNFVFNCKMEDETSEETVNVAGEGASSASWSITSLNSRDIENVPAINRALASLIKFVPQVYISAEAIANGDGDCYQSEMVLDGARFPYSVSPISLDAIEQISIATTPFDVRQNGFAAGTINAISRSGSNNFEASAYTFYNNHNFQIFGARVGTPIVKDKLFFFSNVEYQKASSQLNMAARVDWNISRDHKFKVRYIGQEAQQHFNSVAAELNSLFLEGSLNNIFRTSYTQFVSEKNFDITDELSLSKGINYLMAGVKYESYYHLLSFYLQDELSFTERFKLTAGARVEMPFKAEQKVLFSPRIGFNWDVLGDRSVVFRGGTGIFTYSKEYVMKLWKSALALDVRLPGNIISSIEGIYEHDKQHYSATAKLQTSFNNGFSGMVAYSYSNSKKIYQLYGEEVVGYLANVMPHRIIGSLSHRFEYAKHFGTTICLFYTGGPQGRTTYKSFTVSPSGYVSPMLMDIPLSKRDITFSDYHYLNSLGEEVLYSGDAQSEDFWKYVNQDKYLYANRGKKAEPYGVVHPWSNQFDLRIAQDFFLNVKGKRHTLRLGLDIMNIGNLFNPEWGSLYQCVNTNLLRQLDDTYQFQRNGDAPLTETWEKSMAEGSTYSLQLSIRYIFK